MSRNRATPAGHALGRLVDEPPIIAAEAPEFPKPRAEYARRDARAPEPITGTEVTP